MKTLFEIAKSGLHASDRSMSVTSNNIINADTPGYSRQRVEKSPAGMQMDQYHVGLGVNVEQVSRLRDKMSDVLLNKKQQNMGYLEKKAGVYEKLQSSMVTDYGADLDSQVGNLFDNFSDLASNPQDVSVRNNLVSETQQLTSKLHQTSHNISQNSDLVKEFANKTLDSINGLLNDINELNGSIKQAQAKGSPDFASLDKRVAKMDKLSKLVDFDSRETRTGAVEIQIDGHSVVDENRAYKITSEVDDVHKKFRLRLPSGHTIAPSQGRIGAEIEMYQEGIPDLKKKLDSIASTIVNKVNDLHSNGYGLDDNVQRNFFDPSGKTAESIKINDALVQNSRLIASSDTADEAGNGEIAAQIADLRNKKLIGDNSANQTLTDYTVGTISTPGVKLDAINNRIDARDSEIQMLKNQQEQTAGVNIDEELSKMIKYQNAYQGAAKVMSSAQQMYDTLISIVR